MLLLTASIAGLLWYRLSNKNVIEYKPVQKTLPSNFEDYKEQYNPPNESYYNDDNCTVCNNEVYVVCMCNPVVNEEAQAGRNIRFK